MIRLVVVLVVFILAMLLGHCHAQAQTVQTTPNLVTNTWTGTTPSTSTGGGFSGGNVPAYNSSTNTLMFGYNEATVAQTYAINQALSGSGVQIGGYNYSWQYLNNSSTGGTLSSTIKLTSQTGSTLESYTYGMNVIADGWRTMQGTQNFNQQYGVSSVGNLSIEFTGKDARWWAGLYGPQVRDVNLSLNYTVDPCVSNPLYSPSCTNYNQVLTSQTIYAQQYAINQALNLSGAGVNINGFEYGYHYYVGGDWCSATFMGIFCIGTSPSSMAVDVNVTSNTGSSLYSATHNHTQQNTGGQPSYSYVFPQQRLLSTMGNFSLTTREVGSTALYSSWSRWQYTPDPCTIDPLSSQSCPGYAAAYQTQMCTANPLYNSACPGYAQAMFTQQCTANPLSDASCPGYASAYLTYQCTINPLYSTTCSGYETAYLDQQCSINPLYSTRCSGYTAAYKTQQCTANPLYDSTCDGYSTAYKNQQCTLNALYATDCPGYAAAYKTQQCTANPLYATDCAGYEQAYLNAQCIKDSLYSNKCEGYATAYAIKNLITFSDSTVSSSVNGALSDTAATKANDPANTKVAVNTVTTSINTDGSVSTGVSATGDTNVDKAITAKASTTNTSPAAAVQLAPPPPAPQQQMAQNEPKGGDKPEPKGGNKQEDKKDDAPKGSGGNSPSQNTNNAQASSDKPAAPTARQAIQERREAAAKAEAVEKGKNLANEMGKASDLEAQKAVQNVVIQAMGFTPGFDAYSKQIIVQQQFYKPYQVYGNQKNIDSRANLRMFGGTDSLHQQMIESQYNKGN
jgi:hypothetical protein